MCWSSGDVLQHSAAARAQQRQYAWEPQVGVSCDACLLSGCKPFPALHLGHSQALLLLADLLICVRFSSFCPVELDLQQLQTTATGLINLAMTPQGVTAVTCQYNPRQQRRTMCAWRHITVCKGDLALVSMQAFRHGIHEDDPAT